MKRSLAREAPNCIGQTVQLAGWVNARRNLGKLIFIDLRDSSGLIQVIVSPATVEAYAAAQDIRPEFVVRINGQVQKRDPRNQKPTPTGQVEILAQAVEVLSRAKTPPFEIVSEERQAAEELRLQYRYLDLRHERMHRNLVKRHDLTQFVREYLSRQGFLEIQTPILSKSTPEGARDFLVPSRLHRGKFFALPQSPQQYKQLLMVAGFERYFQVAPCFRDEAARSDRSPGEFYQFDIEMAFVSQEDILRLVEKMFIDMVAKVFPEKRITQSPWPRLTHQEAMKKYKTDKPDLRQNPKDHNELAFAWVLDFPLFVKQTKEDFFFGSGQSALAPSHHMFTAPKAEDVHLLDTAPEKVRSYQHDLVLNGYEVGGGSIRIHQAEVQKKIFDIIGLNDKQKNEFQHLLDAFAFGVPPHGGIAPGVERLLLAILGETSVREVAAFPLTSEGRDLLMGAPAAVTPEQLAELGLRVIKK